MDNWYRKFSFKWWWWLQLALCIIIAASKKKKKKIKFYFLGRNIRKIILFVLRITTISGCSLTSVRGWRISRKKFKHSVTIQIHWKFLFYSRPFTLWMIPSCIRMDGWMDEIYSFIQIEFSFVAFFFGLLLLMMVTDLKMSLTNLWFLSVRLILIHLLIQSWWCSTFGHPFIYLSFFCIQLWITNTVLYISWN